MLVAGSDGGDKKVEVGKKKADRIYKGWRLQLEGYEMMYCPVIVSASGDRPSPVRPYPSAQWPFNCTTPN